MSGEPCPCVKLWAVHYDTPEHPDRYEARLFHNDEPQESVVISDNYEVIEQFMMALQLTNFWAHPSDPPTLIEVWL